MLRHLFTVAASFTVTACVVQPPPGYWARPASPYSRAYYPYAWPPQPAYYAPQPASYMTPPAPGAPQPASWPAQPAALTPEPASYSPPRTDSDAASDPASAPATYADEAVDYGIPPTNTLHLHDFDAPTPTQIEGAHTVTTVELQRMLASDKPPLLIDVIGGAQTVSLPNAVWLRDAGVGRHLDDDVQAWFDLHLAKLTDRDKSRPLVFFCASRMCWLAHNATLRALDLGYTDVYWYRGGRDAWQAAGLPMTPVAPPPVDD